MIKKKLVTTAVIVLIVAAGAFFAFQRYAKLQKELQTLKAQSEQYKFHKDVLEFTKNFVDKVLRAKEEVSFDDRLKLETMVRALNDQEVLNQWKKFVESTTAPEAQSQMKALLSLLLQKI